MQNPKHDEDIDSDAIISAQVSIPTKMLAPNRQGLGDWTVLDSDDVVVRLLLTPSAWRGIAKSLLKYPDEPEWRLLHCAKDENQGLTAWEECRPLEAGPGAFIGDDSCMISIRVVSAPKESR